MRIIFLSRVDRVFKHEPVVSGRKVHDDVILTRENRGWFMLLEGSKEAVHVGYDEPVTIKPGAKCKVTIEVEE